MDSDKQLGKPGRVSTYSDDVAFAIIEQITEGIPLAEICRMDSMPGLRTVYDWMETHKEFAARFARAREQGYDRIAADCLRISNEPLTGEEVTETPDGVTIKRGDMLGHRKLQIETRLKLLAKWDPKRYGDQPAQTNVNVGVVVASLTEEKRAKIMALRRQSIQPPTKE